jgi:hypothetical protein
MVWRHKGKLESLLCIPLSGCGLTYLHREYESDTILNKTAKEKEKHTCTVLT